MMIFRAQMMPNTNRSDSILISLWLWRTERRRRRDYAELHSQKIKDAIQDETAKRILCICRRCANHVQRTLHMRPSNVDHEYYVRMLLDWHHLAAPRRPIHIAIISNVFYWIRCRLSGLCECARGGIDLMRQQISPDHINLIWKFQFYLFARFRCGLLADGICTTPSASRRVLVARIKMLCVRLNEQINRYLDAPASASAQFKRQSTIFCATRTSYDKENM